MFSNKSTSLLFKEIVDAFFYGHQEYYVHYFDNNGVPSLSSSHRHVVPTYMVHHTKGEIVISDTGLRSVDDTQNKATYGNVDILFEDPERIKKIGVLFQPLRSKELHVRWIAIEENGVVGAVRHNRDLHRDLSLIAKALGIKPNKVRVA